MPLLSTILSAFVGCLAEPHRDLVSVCEISLTEQLITLHCPSIAVFEAICDAWISIAVDFHETKKRLGAPDASRLKVVYSGQKPLLTNGLPKSFLLQKNFRQNL